MRRSNDRIIVSHAGALPRPTVLTESLRDENLSSSGREEALGAAVQETVSRQVTIGIDVLNDGEVGKPGSFLTYIRDRIDGIEARPDLRLGDRDAGVIGRELLEFKGYYAAGLGGFHTGDEERARPTGVRHPFVVAGKMRYKGAGEIGAEIERLKRACSGLDVEPYLPATAPGTIEHWLWRQDAYSSDADFLLALAEVLHEEYKAIVDAGLVLQVDDPGLADGWQMFPEMSIEEYRAYARVRVEALNHALSGIPEDRVRFHTCWGSFHSPHRNDLPLADIVDLVLAVDAECYSIEASNGRHEHEWALWQDVKLPEGKSLMPGVVGHASDIVEHPDLVAQRLVRYASVVGRENVIAGTDCGLGTRVHPEVAWAKLEELAHGAEVATRRLWP